MATSLKQMIQELVKPYMPYFTVGVVTGENPLRVTLLNDLHTNLSAVSLTIPSRLLPLKEGERVYMLVTNGGNSYYVMDRV